MGRRKKTWFELLEACPWWVSVSLSLGSFVLFRFILPHISMHTSDIFQASFFKALQANGYLFAPYLALFLLLPLPFSVLNKRNRTQVLNKQTGLHSIRDLDWKKFEQLVGEAFRRKGYLVSETGQGGADGGIDLRLRKGSEVFLVQCKQWRAYKVSVNIVRELYGVMAAKGVTGGFVITSGHFTEDAKTFASGRNIELIDGQKLATMIATVQPTNQSCAFETATLDAVPDCPKCNSPMVKRTARQGANAGGQFWGCTRFPECRGIRSIS
jgi:restriction system protein